MSECMLKVWIREPNHIVRHTRLWAMGWTWKPTQRIAEFQFAMKMVDITSRWQSFHIIRSHSYLLSQVNYSKWRGAVERTLSSSSMAEWIETLSFVFTDACILIIFHSEELLHLKPTHYQKWKIYRKKTSFICPLNRVECSTARVPQNVTTE